MGLLSSAQGKPAPTELRPRTELGLNTNFPVCAQTERRTPNELFDELHDDGYIILPGPTPVAPETSSGWFCKQGHGLVGGEGRSRHQCRDYEDGYRIAGRLRKALEEVGMLGVGGVLGRDMRIRTSRIYGLRDVRGTGAQRMHTDYELPFCKKYASDRAHTPLSVIWACSADFLLKLERGSLITVPRGEMIVFRGDLSHGGGGHLSYAFRVHAYLAHCQLKIPDKVYWTE